MEFLIRYQVAPEDADAQVAAVRKFKDGMRADNDPDQRYDVYREADEDGGVTFVHLAWMAKEEDFERFRSTDHFKEFTDGLKLRAKSPPTVTPLISVAVDHVGLLGRSNS
jgi:quinol monooxygenase YgiN